MKILILGTPRSGSTSFTRLIDSHIKLPNYKMVIEPFNNSLYFDGNNTIDTLLEYENILVKNLFLIGNDEYPKSSFIDVYEYFKWCYGYFDKIVLLDRKDKIAQSESFVVNETMWREKGVGWHTPKIYDTQQIEQSYIETMVSRYTESGDILYRISIEHNFPLFYYEDIFLEHSKIHIDKVFNYLNIELIDKHYQEYVLSPYRRVRIDKNKQNLI